MPEVLLSATDILLDLGMGFSPALLPTVHTQSTADMRG